MGGEGRVEQVGKGSDEEGWKEGIFPFRNIHEYSCLTLRRRRRGCRGDCRVKSMFIHACKQDFKSALCAAV